MGSGESASAFCRSTHLWKGMALCDKRLPFSNSSSRSWMMVRHEGRSTAR